MKCAVVETANPTFRVPRDHPIFIGHFPGMPLVPGVMLLEWALRETARSQGLAPVDLRIRESKFLSALRPEEQAELVLTHASPRHAFRILRGSELIATGVLERK